MNNEVTNTQVDTQAVIKKIYTKDIRSKFEEIQYRSELIYSKIIELFDAIEDIANKTELPEEIVKIKDTLNKAKTDGPELNIVLIYRETFNEMNAMPLPYLTEAEYNKLNTLYETWKNYYDTNKFEDLIEQGKNATAKLRFNYNKTETENKIADYKEKTSNIDEDVLNYKRIKEIRANIQKLETKNKNSKYNGPLGAVNNDILEETNRQITDFFNEYNTYNSRVTLVNECKEQISNRYKGLKQKLCNLIELVSISSKKEGKEEISPTLNGISEKLDEFEIWVTQLSAETNPSSIDVLEALIKDKTETFNKLEEDIIPLMNKIHESFSPLIDKIKKEEPVQEVHTEAVVEQAPVIEEPAPVVETVQEPVQEPVIQSQEIPDDEHNYYKRAIAASSTIVKLAHDNNDPLKQLYNALLTDIDPLKFTEEDYERYCTLFHNLIESAWYDDEKKRKVLEEVEEFINKFKQEEEPQMTK